MRFEKADYICDKCGCTIVIAKPSGPTISVYCSRCRHKIANTTYAGMLAIYEKLKGTPLGEEFALKSVKKNGKVVRMNCSKCGCLLHNSSMPRPRGQFDLVDADYCPKCGRELL